MAQRFKPMTFSIQIIIRFGTRSWVHMVGLFKVASTLGTTWQQSPASFLEHSLDFPRACTLTNKSCSVAHLNIFYMLSNLY